MSKVAAEVAKAGKIAGQYFEKREKGLLYHADVLSHTDWLLCNNAASNKDEATIQQPSILLEGLLPPDEDNCYVIAIPHPGRGASAQKSYPGGKPLVTPQELQQVIHELVNGVYVFNQLPSSSVEINSDGSMGCHLPSAYADTLVGQTLLSVDYFIKSLLHGTTVSHREKRARVTEKWRKTVSDSPGDLRQLYLDHGMTGMQEDKELGDDLYKETHSQFVRHPPLLVDSPLAEAGLGLHLSTGEASAQRDTHVSRDVFLKYLNKACLGLAVGLEGVQQGGSLMVFEPSLEVISHVEPDIGCDLSVTKEDGNDMHSHLNVYLQKQREFVDEALQMKSSVLRDIQLLQFAAFLVHLLVTLKHQHKIVDCEKFRTRTSPDAFTTEREFPPFLPSMESHWSPFTSSNHHANANGGIVFRKQETKVAGLSKSFVESKEKVMEKCGKHEKQAMTITIDDRTYTLIAFHLEEFYPKFPRPIHAMKQELKTQIVRLPPLNDQRVRDVLRRSIGQRQASKLKTMNSLVVPCIQKGLAGCVAALLKRCTKARICNPCEEDGLSLVHHAAIHCRSDILTLLLHYNADPNQFTQPVDSSSFPLGPLHLAAFGSLDSICSLLKNSAEPTKPDDRGWLPVHYAAYNNQQHIITYLAKIDSSCVNFQTSDSLKSSPLLLAAKNCGLDSVKVLVAAGGDLLHSDTSGRNIVHVAALKNHVKILQYLMELEESALHVMEVLMQMLEGDTKSGYPHAAACVVDSLLRWRIGFWREALELGMVKRLVELAKMPDQSLQLLAVQVLADMSNNAEVKSVLVQENAIPSLVKHLSTDNDRLQSTACLVLSDLAQEGENKSAITADGGMGLLIKLLASPEDDIQLYSSACLGILAMGNDDNRRLFRENGGLQYLIALLSSTTDCISGTASAACEELLSGCRDNQLAALHEDIIPPLVALLRSRTVSVHSSAANAIRALAEDCPESQAILQQDSAQCTPQLRRLLKSLAPGVKVCAGTALWAIAGDQTKNRRSIAHFMGLDSLIDLLSIHDSRLDYVCSEALGALAGQLGDSQQKIHELGGLSLLVEVLITKSSEHVYISVLNTLGTLLTKPGLVPNVELQKAVADARGLTFITALLLSPLPESIRVNAASTLAKLVLHNKDNEDKLVAQSGFSYLAVLKLLSSTDPDIRKMAGYALSVFVFNNPNKLDMIKRLGMIHLANFSSLLKSTKDHQAHAAFQLVILSRIIRDLRHVDACIYGIKLLIKLSSSPVERTKLLCLEFIACLARSREGIPKTSIMAGVLAPLLDNLLSKNPPVEEMSSIALGLYSHVPLASRLIRSRFRQDPSLFKVFDKYIAFANPSKQFIDEWECTEKAGLPSLSLQKHGGPAIGEGWKSSKCDEGMTTDTLSIPVPDGPPAAGTLTARKKSLQLQSN